MRKVVDTVLPVTMVGSYPRPLWYKHQLHGQDIQHAFKLEEHAQAYEDATAACIRDQEEAGLDIVADGQMYFDEYGASIGSFVWYWYERLPGFYHARRGAEPASADIVRSGRRAHRDGETGGAVVVFGTGRASRPGGKGG